MEKTEPTLVPEWLKGTGNVTGGGSASHHSGSPSSHSDEPSVALPTKNRSSVNGGDYDSLRSSANLERTSSSYFRRSSSSNGSMGLDKDNSSHSRGYSSFGRSYRDRERDKDILNIREKDRSSLRDKRDRDYFDTDVFTSRIEKDMFRRSQSMISGKQAEVRPRRRVADSNNYTNNNGVPVGSKLINLHKGTFERDFPSLGAEEKHGVDRVASPGLSIAAQSLPMSTSAMIMGNGWTSALAEVPAITGSNNMGLSPVPQIAASSLGSLPPSTTGLNMAETVAQAPLKARAAPQLSLETQRLEELAIKQSRQLIPMTPSMPKNSVSNLEKQKPKVSARSEASMASKIGVQPLSTSQPVSHHLRGGAAKPDVTKTSNGGKLLVLKAARENGASLVVKESSSPTNAGRVSSNNSLGAAAPSVGSVPTRSLNNSKVVAAERKATSLPVNKMVPMEKKPINSQAQSRNDFFNLVRKKTLSNNSSVAMDSGSLPSPTISEKSAEITSMVSSAVSPQGSNTCASEESSLNADHGAVVASNGDAHDDSQGLQKNGEKHSSSDASLDPDEEEAAFLRSLGWEEAGEEEGLTEEEINAFYQEYVKLRPSSKLCKGACLPKLPLQPESHVGGSGQSSTEPKSEA